MNYQQTQLRRLKTEYFLNGATLVGAIWVISALISEILKRI
jgi:hypothetical protein